MLARYSQVLLKRFPGQEVSVILRTVLYLREATLAG